MSFKYTESPYKFNPSPIRKIPTELLRKVFQHLSIPAVARMRLVYHNSSEVGAGFILPKACLVVKKDSFNNLLTISEHLIMRKYVKLLCYRTDLLSDLDFGAWKECLPNPDWTTALAGMDKSHESARHYFPKYQEHVKEQQRVLSDDYAATLATAIRNLPRTKSIAMQYRDMRYRNEASQTAFADALADKGSFVSREATAEDPSGIPHMLYLLQSLAKAGTKLDDFTCSTISWRILQYSETTIAQMKTLFSSLKFLKFPFTTSATNSYTNTEPTACRSHLQRTRTLIPFLASPPLLTSLTPTF